jgi:myo-inositol-1(or 4)-monophosphatase
MAWEKELELAILAAQRAGLLLCDAFRAQKTVLFEDAQDIKLQADRDAEDAILEVLKNTPHDILAEESGEHGALDGTKPIWLVDPLDGTLNFSRNIPLCCVSIALYEGGEPILGVIYEFMRGDLFSGVVDEGAWLNHAPMHVSSIGEARQGILASGFPMNYHYDTAGLQQYIDDVRKFRKLRLYGSAALSLAYVACGRVDAYLEDDIMWWDIAGGLALVKAAGGYVHMEDSGTAKWAKKVRCSAQRSVWET